MSAVDDAACGSIRMMEAWWRESPTPAPADERTLALLSLPSRPDGYAPIADYALIGDTRTAALVARDGSLDWLCLPNVDDASVFAALLDRERGGRFFVGAPGEAEITRHYLDGSPILATRFATPDGVFEVTDLMPLALRDADGPLEPGRRVVRIVEALEGRPRVAVHFAPRPGYAATLPRLRQSGRGSWVIADGRDFLLLQSEIALAEASRATLVGEARLAAGERRCLSLSFWRSGCREQDKARRLRRATPKTKGKAMKIKLIHDASQRIFAVVFDKGDEVLENFRAFAKEHKLSAAEFTGLGAMSDAVLGYFDWQKKDYKRIPIEEQVEVLSLTGNIALADGEPKLHPHIVLGKSDGTAHGGHLLKGHVRPTLEIIVTESPEHLERKSDSETGLALIQL